MGKEVEYYRQQYESLLEQIPNAVFVIDPVGDRLVDVNTAACRLLGYDRKTLLARIRPRTSIRTRSMPSSISRGRWKSEVRLARRSSAA